jgi:hypothetical protein
MQRQLAKTRKALSYIITPQWLIMSAFSLCRYLDLAVARPTWRVAIFLGTGSRVQTITGSLVQKSHNDLMCQIVASSAGSYNDLMYQPVVCYARS